ncbi:ModD protein [Methylocapsa acidiphila]|uniref:ModD protein n=1 Tax=Methylocapsa acidiphila TaxID=133552 RepID=UPI0004245FF3|nr:ModD protein [Methylocapsa acidiphila]
MNLPLLPDALLDQLLADDVPFLDLTTHVLGVGEKAGRMSFSARHGMVAACVEDAGRIIERAGAKVTLQAKSGAELAPGAALLTAAGPASALLRAWKIAQNLIETTAGIATATRRIVEAARAVAPDVAIACTRKNAPGTKLLAVKAILAGGATPHRLGLSETILIFAEHRAFLAGLTAAQMIGVARREAAEKKIVVEVGSLEEALAFAAAGADVIQAEKFRPEQIAALRRALNEHSPRPLIAAAGGVNASNGAEFAAAGADILVTSAPYWGKPLDVAVRIEAV